MRDYRSKEMRILIAAVLCAIICLTAITFSIDSIHMRLTSMSSALIGGDAVISAPEPIGADILKLVKENHLQYTETLNFYSMLSTQTDLMLAAIKAVTINYPLRGDLKFSTELNSLGKVANGIPQPGTIWLESRAMLQLGVKIGDTVSVGDGELQVAAVLTAEPDRIADGLTFAPRVLMNMEDIAATKAVQAGSRVTYKLLTVGSNSNVTNFTSQLQQILPVDYKIRTITSETETFKNLNLAENYLLLAVLINVVLAAVAVGIAATHYAASHTIDAAILRCLGASKRQIIVIYGSSLLVGAIVLGIIGSLFGLLIQQVLAAVLNTYLNLQVPFPSLQPFLYGIGCALLLIIGIAMPRVVRLAKVAPMEILRKSSTVSANSSLRLRFNISHKVPALLRLSLNNISYNFSNNLIQVVAFTLVICVALILFVVRNDLLSTWHKQLPVNTPNYFAVNIPVEVIAEFKEHLHIHDIEANSFYPIVRGTLIRINQQPVNTGEDEEAGKRTGIHRPLNLTWTQTLPNDNQILKGTWFESQDVGNQVVSIEKEMADRLDIVLGDELTFLINTKEVAANVTSIRSVNWDSFQPNFYVIYPDNLINQFPATYMTSFYVSGEQERELLEIVHKFPQINLLSVSAMLDQANIIMSLLVLVISFIWFFTLLVGILLLLAVILASIKLRNYQNNLMRIFGASKHQVRSILILEYVILGSVAGLLGACIAIGVAKYVGYRYFSLQYDIHWWILIVGGLIGAVVMLVGGLLGSYKSLQTAPIQLTRDLS